MTTNCLTLEQIESLKSFLKEKIHPSFIWLFGSAAKGAMNLESDVDLAFMSDDKFDRYQIFMIAQELAYKLGRNVDLIDLRAASTVMRAQIIGKGILLYEQDSLERMRFSMLTLKEYALLNEERWAIIEKSAPPEDLKHD
jgi:predicted nucleotidyltransferase